MNKFLQFPIVRMVIAIFFVGVGVALGQMILNLLRSALAITNTGVANILAFVIVAPLTWYAYVLYVRLVEKREVTELDFSHALPELGLGSLLGFGLFTLIIAVLWLTGSYRVNGVEFVFLALLGTLLGAFVSALAQEIIFRAVIYRIAEEWLGTWWALGISAFVFGLLHLTSEGATIFSALAVALQAGVVLAAVYTLTHRLWMALGLHMLWDFSNDGIFGVGVAGQTGASIKGLLQAKLTGPDWLTGGKLGVEASVICLVVLLLAGIFILRQTQQRGQFVSRKK